MAYMVARLSCFEQAAYHISG